MQNDERDDDNKLEGENVNECTQNSIYNIS